MNPHYAQVSARAGHRCEYCHAPEAIFNFPFEVEHIVPVSKGGIDQEQNMALACRSCNLFKSDFVTGIDPESQVEQRLFQPRLDQWATHFQVIDESARILGLTNVGRATVERLRMNVSSQLNARLAWMRIRLFP